MAEYSSGVITNGLNGRQALVVTEDLLNAEFCNILLQAKPPNALTSLIIEARSVMGDNSSSLLNVRCDAVRMRDSALLTMQRTTVRNSEPFLMSCSWLRPKPWFDLSVVWSMPIAPSIPDIRGFSYVVTGLSTCPSCHAQFKNKTTCTVCGENVRFLRFQDKIENNIVRDQYSHRTVRACMSVSLEVASAENIASQGPSGISHRAMREHVQEEQMASVRAVLFEPSFLCVHDAHGWTVT